jgi:ribonuclease Y
MLLVVAIIVSLILGSLIGILIALPLARKRADKRIRDELKLAKQDAETIKERAKEEIEHLKKKTIIEGREELHRLREEQEKELKKEREEMKQWEDRLSRKEDNLDRKESNLETKIKEVEKEKEEAEKIRQSAEKKIYELSELTQEQAKEIVLERAEKKYEYEVAQRYKQIKEEFEEEADKHAKWILVNTIQRYAADTTGDITVSTVSLPSDEMKGRVIGREGRNIRAFEKLTGADLIIDDTPEVVVVSCFNSLRRAIATRTLETLVEDGRIHPTRIEEIYEKSKKEIYMEIKEAGQDALMQVGIPSMHPELVKLIGRLKFRTSYGQNVLKHSIEVAQIATLMTSELGLNVERVKRGAILHDIGKAVDHEIEGSHAVIGGDLARRYNEKEDVINMIQHHHGDVEAHTPEAVIVAAADAVSAARPGARRESLEMYIKRLENLENIANSFSHVEKAYAIQAGRELRIMVEPDKVDDVLADKLAADVSGKIEEQMEYPGVIKVTVIREKRSVAYAK